MALQKRMNLGHPLLYFPADSVYPQPPKLMSFDITNGG